MNAPGWIAQLRGRADLPPVHPRKPLFLGAAAAAPIGSIEPALGARMVDAGLPIVRRGDGWAIVGAPDEAMQCVARWLHAHSLASTWRDERLAVCDAGGARVGAIERAAARPLGIATRAVHLVGRRADGAVWVQQRAFDKPTDPGLWDTMVGGLMADGETVAAALARETVEEAGFDLGALLHLAARDVVVVRRPVHEGWMVESIEVFEAVVPAPLVPVNRDGEVECFECLSPAALLEGLQAGRFTLEAALILLGSLQRSGHVDA